MSAAVPTIYANGLVADRRGDLPDPEQVEFCRRWLRLFGTRRASINRRRSSYGLKHEVESWSATLGTSWTQVDPLGRRFTSARRYVSNGAFIAAALAEGYRLEQIGGGPNAQFDIDVRKTART